MEKASKDNKLVNIIKHYACNSYENKDTSEKNAMYSTN